MNFTTYLVLYILLGFIPQAVGSAICLYSINKQSIVSKSFWYTSIIYALVSTAIRLAYDYGVIDFGFHTVIIWMIFIVIAIFYNKFPVIQSTVSIMVSGLLITVAELITAVAFVICLGSQVFEDIMSCTLEIDGQMLSEIEGKALKTACGVPANFLFVVITIVFYIVMKKRYEKKQHETSNKGEEKDT